MTFAGGQPLWFWLDWFDGKHVLTELQTERGGSTEREFFLFRSRGAAEGFYGATVAQAPGLHLPLRDRFPFGLGVRGDHVGERPRGLQPQVGHHRQTMIVSYNVQPDR